jgi:hypothetical protein
MHVLMVLGRTSSGCFKGASGKAFELFDRTVSERPFEEAIEMKPARIALFIIFIITLVMGMRGAAAVMYGAADPM